jgi:hypothetical protein
MMQEAPHQAPRGVSAIRRHATAGSGILQKEVFARTPDVKSPAAEAKIAEGTVLRDAHGTPLQGRLTVDLASYAASSDGLRALPASVKAQDDGRVVLSTYRVKVRDDAGRVATQFGSAPRGGPAGDPAGSRAKSGTTGLSLTLSTGSVSTAMELSHYVLRLKSGLSTVDVLVPLSVVKDNSLTFGVQGTQLIVGGVAHDISALVTTASSLLLGQGLFLSLQGQAAQTCTPSVTLDLVSNGQSGTATVAVGGSGLFYESAVSISTGQTKSVSITSVISDPTVPSSPTEWPVTVVAPDGQVATALVDVCGSGNTTIPLPAPSSSLIDATINVEPGCPAGQAIPFAGSIDGYVLSYRKAGTSTAFQPVPGSNVTIFSTNDTFAGIDVHLPNVEAGQNYEFYGSFDGQTGYRTITMPSVNGGSTTFTDTEFSKHCQ